MIKKFIISAVATATLALAMSASATVIIDIANTGGNDPVNVDNPRAWNFGITDVGAAYFSANGLAFNTAIFDAKVHKDTTAPLVFSLYSGLGGNVNGNKLMASVTLPASDFDQQYTDGAGSPFLFTPQTLGMGYYSVTLTSSAPDKSTQDYFLKQGKLVLEDQNQQTLNSSFWLQDQGTGDATITFNGTGSLTSGTMAVAPEPSTIFAMIAITAFSFGGGVVRRIRRKAA